ncbi:hypothetical protein F7725_008762 [Dissostichus mawsoni]|uniref:Uncharacterized protein n=1 Tax=Dissostichus mawsoni TaxID=36200 RepID=A0A7J5YA04_DISMA|nr:hypothetical protein F7725_008762 [Dissostichus mawsoni]
MKKFNIRKVLDGLTAASSSSSSSPSANQTQNDPVPETLQSEHFQLCKAWSVTVSMRRRGGALVSALADDSIHLWNLRQKIPAVLHSLKFSRERYHHLEIRDN